MDFGGALLPHPALVLSLQLKQAGRIEQVHRSAGVQLEKEKVGRLDDGNSKSFDLYAGGVAYRFRLPRSRGEENVASDRAGGIRDDNANDPWQRVVGVASVESRRQAVRSQGLGERRRLA